VHVVLAPDPELATTADSRFAEEQLARKSRPGDMNRRAADMLNGQSKRAESILDPKNRGGLNAVGKSGLAPEIRPKRASNSRSR
jgi:hypothetical protein